MSVAMLERQYDLPEAVALQFFANLEAFARHARDHFTSSDEPWQIVFDRELSERLTVIPLNDVRSPELADAYRDVVEHLHGGITFSNQREVYIRLEQERGAGPEQAYYFLAAEGYVLIARGGLVRTAYFPHASPAESAYNRFRGAWTYLKRKAAKDRYHDGKAGAGVAQGNVRLISEANWQSCPNRHPRRICSLGEGAVPDDLIDFLAEGLEINLVSHDSAGELGPPDEVPDVIGPEEAAYYALENAALLRRCAPSHPLVEGLFRRAPGERLALVRSACAFTSGFSMALRIERLMARQDLDDDALDELEALLLRRDTLEAVLRLADDLTSDLTNESLRADLAEAQLLASRIDEVLCRRPEALAAAARILNAGSDSPPWLSQVALSSPSSKQTPGGARMATFSQGHALIVGVGWYNKGAGVLDVPFASRDAAEVARTLKDPRVGAYSRDQVTELWEEGAATRQAIYAAVAKLRATTKPPDTVVIFLCGHGKARANKGEWYFLPCDAVTDEQKCVERTTAISGQDLLTWMRGIRARKLLLILNACHAGEVGEALDDEDEGGDAPPEELVGLLKSGEGRALLCACRGKQKSQKVKGEEHTYFGQALVEGLRGQGVTNRRGCVDLYDLYDHIFHEVSRRSPLLCEPVLSVLRIVGGFPVALHKGGDVLGEPDFRDRPTATAFEEVNPAQAEAAARWLEDAGRHLEQVAEVRLEGSGTVAVDQSRKSVFDGGRGNSYRDLTFGDMAGGNIQKTSVTLNLGEGADRKTELREGIARLRAELAQTGLREQDQNSVRAALTLAEVALGRGDMNGLEGELMVAAGRLRSANLSGLSDAAARLLQLAQALSKSH